MDDRQRLRVLLLLMAGVLLGGGVFMWTNLRRQQQEEVHHVAGLRPAVDPAKTVATVPPVAPAQNTSPAAGSVPPGQTAAVPTASGSAAPQLAALPVPAASVPSATAIPSQTADAPRGAKSLPATPRILAASDARNGAGRKDPMERVDGYTAFPRIPGSSPPPEQAAAVPPPPPPGVEEFVPPPPPEGVEVAGAPGQPGDIGLPVDELPVPPSKPSLAEKMKLIGIIGDRAIISFDPRVAIQKKWPRTITLGKGEEFESVRLVDVQNDSVVLDEEGDRTVKNMQPVVK